MSVSTQTTSRPARCPARASPRRASARPSIDFMNAPSPTLTSSTIASAPAAIFFDMMLAAISDDVVDRRSDVAQRVQLFVGRDEIRCLCRRSRAPTSRTCPMNSSRPSSTRKPGIDSSLSSVPPVWPSPRPLILPNGTPHAATIGPTAIDVLSPTPPVECLSTTRRPSAPPRSTVSPLPHHRLGQRERLGARSARGSRRPCRTRPAGSPARRRAHSRGRARASSSPESSPPSRLRSISSAGWIVTA